MELFLFFSRVFIRSSSGCRPRRSLSGFFRDTSEEEEGKKKKVSEIAERCNDRRGAKSGRGGGWPFYAHRTVPLLSPHHATLATPPVGGEVGLRRVGGEVDHGIRIPRRRRRRTMRRLANRRAARTTRERGEGPRRRRPADADAAAAVVASAFFVGECRRGQCRRRGGGGGGCGGGEEGASRESVEGGPRHSLALAGRGSGGRRIYVVVVVVGVRLRLLVGGGWIFWLALSISLCSILYVDGNR